MAVSALFFWYRSQQKLLSRSQWRLEQLYSEHSQCCEVAERCAAEVARLREERGALVKRLQELDSDIQRVRPTVWLHDDNGRVTDYVHRASVFGVGVILSLSVTLLLTLRAHSSLVSRCWGLLKFSCWCNKLQLCLPLLCLLIPCISLLEWNVQWCAQCVGSVLVLLQHSL